MGFKVKCVPVLDKMPCCCCSCDLKVATCILGWLGLIGNVGNLLRSALGLAKFEDTKDVLPQDMKEVLIGTVVTAAIGIILMALLLYGAHTEKPGFMLPALIFDMIAIVIVAGVLICGSIVLLIISSFLISFVLFLVGMLIVVLSTFFWVVIYSYYRKLEERRYPFPAATLDHDGKQVTMHIGHT